MTNSFKKLFSAKNCSSFDDAVNQLGFPKNAKFVKMEQVHDSKITDLDGNKPVYKNNILEIKNVDACFTNQKNIFLSVKSADCLPILIYGSIMNDDSKKIKKSVENNFEFVAAAHAGRKGTKAKILLKLLEKLNSKYNFASRQKRLDSKLYIWFGPAICFDCYQIDRANNTHYDLIKENKKQLDEFIQKYSLNQSKNLQLEIINQCTLHENEKYYSYRATGPGVKMNYSFIGLV